jgi:anaerobic selenocysteine-containing dehydrogenase
MKFSRRSFLKLGTAGAASLGTMGFLKASSDAMELIMGGAEVSRTTGKYLKPIPSTCLNCYARCGNYGFNAYGTLLKIGPNPEHPNSRGRMCAKGQAGLNLVYDPDRVLYPMKRVGPRGDGKWERISWEEAYNQIADRMKSILADGRPEEFLFQSDRDITTQDITRRFVHAFGSPNALVNHPLGGANKQAAQRLTWGTDYDIPDVANTEYMLIFGSNPFEAHYMRTSFVQRMVEGRSLRSVSADLLRLKAKMVTFDVRVSQTSGRSDEWHPILPGTDGVVALAMCHVIMEEGLEDRDFLNRWTNYPPDKLKQHLKDYTPDVAAKISGVPEQEIRRIAREFATAKPATTISTGGVAKHRNGVYSERCVALLNVITGNIDIKGGYCLPKFYRFHDPEPIPQAPKRKSKLDGFSSYPLAATELHHRVLPLIKEGRQHVEMYMTYQHNPAYSHPEGRQMELILKDQDLIPFYVAIDSFMTESSTLADLVLPAATFIERTELEAPPAFDMIPFISFRQPLIPPLGESVPITDILIELAHRVGGGMEKYFNFTSEEYLKQRISGIASLVQAGGLDYLKKHGVFYDTNMEPQYQSYKTKGFNTPSGKIEIYSSRLEKEGFHPLPIYDPIPSHQTMKENELFLIIHQWMVHTHDRTANCMWLSEIIHENPLYINSQTAKKNGLKKYDRVKLISKAGEIETEIRIVEGIHPRVLAMGDSCGHWGFGRIAQAEAFKSPDPNTRLLWWGKEKHGWWHTKEVGRGNGAHPKPIIPIMSDPIGGGQCWMDTKVRIKKA